MSKRTPRPPLCQRLAPYVLLIACCVLLVMGIRSAAAGAVGTVGLIGLALHYLADLSRSK